MTPAMEVVSSGTASVLDAYRKLTMLHIFTAGGGGRGGEGKEKSQMPSSC